MEIGSKAYYSVKDKIQSLNYLYATFAWIINDLL